MIILPKRIRQWSDTAIMIMAIFYTILGIIIATSIYINKWYWYVFATLFYAVSFIPFDFWTPEK